MPERGEKGLSDIKELFANNQTSKVSPSGDLEGPL
jgi:hypothetical protein